MQVKIHNEPKSIPSFTLWAYDRRPSRPVLRVNDTTSLFRKITGSRELSLHRKKGSNCAEALSCPADIQNNPNFRSFFRNSKHFPSHEIHSKAGAGKFTWDIRNGHNPDIATMSPCDVTSEGVFGSPYSLIRIRRTDTYGETIWFLEMRERKLTPCAGVSKRTLHPFIQFESFPKSSSQYCFLYKICTISVM